MTERLGPYELNTIVTGDARELAKAIPDESVDLIMCDPVYWNIEDYAWLAHTAERLLVDGGNVIAQAGSEFRYEAETAMRQSSLNPRPLLAEQYTGGFMQMWKHGSLDGYAPYLWFSKGDVVRSRELGWVHTIVRGGGKSQSVHRWGDSPDAFARWMKVLTNPGAIVFDPFTGGGTVPAVCKMLCRRYLAFEIDPATAAAARERVRNTQPPLPLRMAVQEALL